MPPSPAKFEVPSRPAVNPDPDLPIRIYLAATSAEEVAFAYRTGAQPVPRHRGRTLFSFFYMRKKRIELAASAVQDALKASHPTDMFADSGGFSAWSLGKPISLDDYIAWIQSVPGLFSLVSTLDVIGDAEATAKNTERMLHELPGEPVMPTFHVGSDWKWLAHWAPRVKQIALGGMVPHASRMPFLRAWLARAFSMIPATTRVHGFGLTVLPLVKEFPFYSVDSSTWLMPLRYGHMYLFDPERGAFENIGRSKADLGRLKHRDLLASYGVDAGVGFPACNHKVLAISIESWRRAELWLQDWKRKKASLSCPT